MKKIFLAVSVVLLVVAACKTSKETSKKEVVAVKPVLDCSTLGMTYASIKPIFDKNCISCHGYGGAGGYNLESVADIKRAATKGELLGTIKHLRGFPNMPANSAQLDQASIDMIECWINNGMKD